MENGRKKYIVLLLTITCFMVIGFAVLSTAISLDGTTTVNANTWNVKFQNIVEDSNNTVTASTTPTISDNTSVSFAVTLDEPGDKYSFTVDVVNTGSIDAMINTISKTSLTNDQAKYLDYTVTYSDGIEINKKDKLVKTSGSETIKITLEFKTDVSSEDLPSSTTNINLTFGLNFIQADSTSLEVDHSLPLFIEKAKAGNAISSDVGTTFIVNLGSTYGTHILRVANVSTPSSCSGADFSQTACGVVLEFTDIITESVMNSTRTNVGGWPATSLRTFVNNDIYNLLPTILKNAIIDTIVISGHGSISSGEDNFVSTDKLYFLEPHEVWNDVNSDKVSLFDYAYNNTRQLDYYDGLNITMTSGLGARKRYNGTLLRWWLRSSYGNNNYTFFRVDEDGAWGHTFANEAIGVSPAFRIA